MLRYSLLAALTLMLSNQAALAGPCDCDADLNNDGFVNLADLAFIQHCVIDGVPPPDGTIEDCDVNCDGNVNFCDINAVLCQIQSGGDDPTCCQPCGSCCIDGTSCSEASEDQCDQADGVFGGAGTVCANTNAAIVDEPGGQIFIHKVGPDEDCTGGDLTGAESASASARREGCPPGGPYQDPWLTAAGAGCHNFGVPGSPPIPADFFEPGSDPFVGEVCMVGVPLGIPEFGDADTIIERPDDPFDRCELPGPGARTVPIQIVALSLRSIDPITVIIQGQPTEWDVVVDLSEIPAPPGFIQAQKQHCNGGSYTSLLNVSPRFTFTRLDNPGVVRVLDTGVEGIPPVTFLQFEGSAWSSDLDQGIGANVDHCSDFHAGYEDRFPALNCDCNNNNVRDTCDIEDGVEDDCNENSVPDQCDIDNDTSTDENMNGIPDECEVTGVGEANLVASRPSLDPASPNPIATSTTFSYTLTQPGRASLSIYDVRGRWVSTLVTGQHESGTHSVEWDGHDDSGARVARGVYFAKLETSEAVIASKIVVVE